MRILLTGAAGFIGSHVTEELLRRGCRVTALLRPGGDTARISRCLSELETLPADFEAPGPIDLGSSKPDVLVHLAWYCAPADYRSSPRNADWIASSMRLIQGAAAAGCRRVVVTGTCFEYAQGGGVFSEASPIDPLNLYAASKRSLCLIAERYCAENRISLAWPRLFYLYGPRENEKRLMPYVINRLLAGENCPLTAGTQVRDFLHVADVASAVCDGALSAVDGPLNIGSGVPVTVAEVAREIGRQLGGEDLLALGAQPTPPGDPPFICADPGKLAASTGWRPRFDLQTGLADAIEWWRERRAGSGQ